MDEITMEIQFEQDYLFRNHRNITSIPDIALTELIANAWDAGAYNVDIRIPFETGQMISIEDDGTGMTDEEFRSRWMTLNYNRRRQQGE
jgi:HSP90 family molecular chaperone